MRATYSKRLQARQLEAEREAYIQAGGKITRCPAPDWDSFVNRKATHHGAMSSPIGGISA